MQAPGGLLSDDEDSESVETNGDIGDEGGV